MTRRLPKESERRLHPGVDKIEWGRYVIGGPRHDYRESLLLRSFLRHVSQGYILDAGCGAGSLLFRLLEKGFRVVGVESATEYIEAIQRRIEREGWKENASVQAGSVTALSLKNEVFDGLLCGEVLEHIRDDRIAVKEFWRVLKPGGVCACSVPANPDLWDPSDEAAGHKRRYRKQEIEDLFAGEGFQVMDVFHWGFPLVRWYHRTLYLRRLRKAMEGERTGKERYRPLAVKNRLLSACLSALFRFDDLFRSWPLGIGLILVARKRGTGGGRPSERDRHSRRPDI